MRPKHYGKVKIPYDYIPASTHVTSRAFEDRQRARMRAAQELRERKAEEEATVLIQTVGSGK